MTAIPTTDNAPNKKSKKKLLIILSVVLGVVLIAVSAFFITVRIGEMKLRKNLVANERSGVKSFEFDIVSSILKTIFL